MRPVVRRRSFGFTLIELLIALALVSLISVLVFSGLNLGSKTWEAVETSSNRTDALRLAHGFLRRLLGQIRFVSMTVDGETVDVFGGDSTHLDFAAPLSDHVGLSGVYVLRLSLEETSHGRAVVLTRWLIHPEVLGGGDGFPAWQPFGSDKDAAEAGLPPELDAADGAFGRAPLVDQVDVFDVAYYGLADGDTEPDWHLDWIKQSNPPLLLRIRLTTSAQSWPELLIALPTQR